MKPIGYLLTSLSVAGLLSVAVAAQSADKAAAEKTTVAATTAEKTSADASGDKADCEGERHARREHGHRGHDRDRGSDERADWRRGDRAGHHGDEPQDGGRAPFAKLLGLSDAQKKTLDSAREKEQAAAAELRTKAIAAREALVKAGNTNASDAELNKLAANSASLRAQLELGRIKMHRQLLSVLTPEQKQKLTEWEVDHQPGERRGPPL